MVYEATYVTYIGCFVSYAFAPEGRHLMLRMVIGVFRNGMIDDLLNIVRSIKLSFLSTSVSLQCEPNFRVNVIDFF